MKQKEESPANHADAPAQEFSLISNDTLLALYRNLLKSRIARARLNHGSQRSTNRAWPFDAAAVALADDLVDEDTVVTETHNPALQPFRGNTRDSHPAAIFIEQLQRAVGAALTHHSTKSGKVSVVFGGRGDSQAWLNTLEIARAHRLPMIFVIDADTVEKAAGSSRKTRATELEPGTELPHIIADGHDVVAMYRVAHEAIDRARRDRGPTLIECIAFRLASRRHQDSIATMENYLRGKGLFHRGLKQEILEEIASQSKPAKKPRRPTQS
jgi:pyruvate dehydrogenase E1 component alpha subunit